MVAKGDPCTLPESIVCGCACVRSSCWRENCSEDDRNMDIDREIYRLTEKDVPGASLKGRKPDLLTVVELKRWLACRGARRSGKKAELVTR